MKFLLKDKVVLVTGGAVGLGKGLVKDLVNKQAKVVFCDINEEDGRVTEKEYSQILGSNVTFIKCDVSDYNQVEGMFNQIIKKFGRIDVLINNAAKQTVNNIQNMGYEEFNDVVSTNLNGAFYCMKNAAKHMKAKSAIINILTIYWSKARVDKFHYDASKAGLANLTSSFALALAEKEITVNGIYPGFLNTPLFQPATQEQIDASVARNKVPNTDVSDPEAFAEYVTAFIENFSVGTTGQILGIEAGRSL